MIMKTRFTHLGTEAASAGPVGARPPAPRIATDTTQGER
ncbi:hypothetical protein C357_06222 [Citreicella sp. 357]|nr:hypothetical protein C357_06222 [Citreicella sp. 357]